MDWNAAIEKNREALKRVLVMLVAMAALPVLRARGDAGIAGAAAFTSPLWGGRREASGGGCVPTTTPTRRSDDRRPPHKGEVEPEFRPTLPRHLHRAVLRLLRPAEAAARRLVIVAARGVVVPLPLQRLRKSKPTPTILRNGVGTGILMPHLLPRASLSRTAPRALALSLFDPLRGWGGRHRPVARCVPRISAPGYSVPFPVAVRCPPSPGDPIDAKRLTLRLQALGRALDHLPAEARRFARWRASRGAAGAQIKESRGAEGAQKREARGCGSFRRVWPLRPGRPPGWCRSPTHDVHEILNVAHGLAIWALKSPDTS